MPTPPKPGSNAARKRAAAPTTEASHKRAATRTHTPAGDDDVLRFAHAAPPPWLNMTSAKALQLNAAKVAHWTAGGKAAAQRGEELDQLRLLGSVELSFTRDDCSDGMLAERLGLLEKPTKSRVADAKWYRSRRPVDVPTEAWHKTTGEFVGQGFVSPSLLLQAIFDGHLLPEQEWAAEVLEAVGLLTTPDALLWGCPLMRTIIAPPAALRAAALERGGKGGKGGAKKRATAVKQEAAAGGGAGSNSAAPTIELTAHVYVTRLLLYLVAHPSIRVLLSRLTPPAGGGIVQPLDALPSYPQCFLSHGGANASPFSLEGVLKACEHRGYREAAQPRGVALGLKRYQAQALAWMQDMEALPRGINGLFWEERAFGDGGTYYFSPQLGEMRLEAPPLMHGGLLCDEMGLGKTLELVSLVVATLEQPQPPPPEGLLASRATLIVVPVTLVSQWMAEIAKSVGAGSPLTYRKYTSDSLIKRDGGGAWRRAAAALAAHDIVVTTYPALDKCVAALPHVAWKRVVLDEMQEVRSSTTELARKCERLHGGLRWMVSGTPLYDKISDLQGELNFLRVSPFGAGHEDGFWRHVIGAPWQASDDSALDALQLLLHGVMMRHSKTQTWMDGTTILALPPRELVLTPVQLEGSERAAYVWLEQLIVAEVARTNALLEAGSAARSSGGALLVTGLRLLREASVAMQLLGGGGGVSEQLKAIEEIARAQLQALGSPSAAGAADPADVNEVRLTCMTPSQALQSLGSLDRRATEAAHASSLYNAQHRGDFQRHANQRQRVYDRSRSYAMESLDEKFEQAEAKREELEQEAVAERWLAATRRWQWALERVTTGALLCRGAEADAGAPADVSPAPGPGPGPGSGPKPPLGGRFAWLWLHRAVMLHAADERLRAAEAALARAEASVKAPALTRLRDGSYQNSCGEALHVLASPVRLREARAEQDEAFNREQLRGRVRKGAVVEVDGFSSDDGQHRGCDVRAEAGEDGGEEGDEDGDAANGDECYVSVVADEPNGVPAGWVHNRQVVVGTKLYEACTKLGLQVDASQLTSGKDGRTAVSDEHRGVVFREAFKGLRAARDEARALVRGTAAPAVYGRAPLRRLMEGPALAALGGGVRALRPVAALLAREPRPYATTAGLLSQARAALLAVAGPAAGGGGRAAAAAAATTAAAAVDKAVRTLRDLIEEHVGAVGPIGWRPTSKALEAIRAQHAHAATGWAWLRSSTLQLRGLPAAATGADLEAALGRFVGGGLARVVVVREGQPKGAALVNLGHESGAAAALREASASGKGLPLPLPAEAEALAAATRTLEAEVERLKEVVKGGKSADSRKLLEEKKKRLVELKAGRRAWLVGSGRASRPLLPAAGEATGVSIEACGRFRTEARARAGLASLVLPRLLRGARAHGAQLRVAETSLNELLPYIAKLSAAIELGLDSSAVEQSGFQELFTLESGKPATGSCPICYERVGNSSHCVVTPCAHLFCKSCLLHWMRAQNVMLSEAARQGMSLSSKLCPCCRHPFTLSDLIEIRAPTSGGGSAEASGGGGGGGGGGTEGAGSGGDEASGSGSGSGAGGSEGAGPSGVAGPSECGGPQYCDASTLEEAHALPAPPGEPVRNLRYPSISPSLLAHLAAATGLPPGAPPRGAVGATPLPSAKVRRLLSDLEALGEDELGAPRKAVVFSSHKAAVKHLDAMLGRAGVPHVTIVKGDQHAHLESAVETWSTKPSCRVFLLHAGAAAAGLTLVAAQHVFLMEPFSTPGQELQALNRCHRIGQTRPVTCTTYYCERTVEERLLAFRALEHRAEGEGDDGEAVSLLTESGGAGGRDADSALSRAEALLSPRKLRFVLGMRHEQPQQQDERERAERDADSDVDMDAEAAE